MPNPKRYLHLLLLASLGLAGGCATTPTATPAAAQADSEMESTVEPISDDGISGPIPTVELTPELLYNLLVAEFAGQRGAPRLAAEQYLKLAAQTRDPRLAKRAARFAMYGNELPLALQAATLWSDLAPDDIDASQALAALFISADRISEARPHLLRIINSPSMKQGHGYLVAASLLGRAGDKTQALAMMQELIKGHEKEAAPLYAYASLAAQQENYPVALQSLEQLLQAHPNHLQGLILKSRLLHTTGRKDEAITTLASAVKQAPDNIQLRLVYARMLVDERRLDEAQREFRTLNRQSPDNPDVLYALGLLALQHEDLNEGAKHFQRLLQLQQHEAEANYALGQIAEERNEVDKAISYYEAVDNGDNQLDARLRTALLIEQRDGIDKARDYLHALNPDNAADIVRVTLLEGEMLREAGRDKEAMDVYNDAIALFPDNDKLLYARAMVAERVDRLDILEQDLRTILRHDPNHVQALNALGFTLADRTNRLQEAHELVSKAFSLSPDDAAIIDSMGWVLYRMGRNEEALGYLQQALQQQPDPEIAAHLGEVLWVSGKQKEARKVWDKALKQWPNDPMLQKTVERLRQ